MLFAGLVIPRLATGGAFNHCQHQGKAEQAKRQLRGTRAIPQREPAGVNAGGKSLHAKIGDSAKIGDGLHHRQQYPDAMAGRAMGRLTSQKA